MIILIILIVLEHLDHLNNIAGPKEQRPKCTPTLQAPINTISENMNSDKKSVFDFVIDLFAGILRV